LLFAPLVICTDTHSSECLFDDIGRCVLLKDEIILVTSTDNSVFINILKQTTSCLLAGCCFELNVLWQYKSIGVWIVFLITKEAEAARLHLPDERPKSLYYYWLLRMIESKWWCGSGNGTWWHHGQMWLLTHRNWKHWMTE